MFHKRHRPGSDTFAGNVIIRHNVMYDNAGAVKHRNGNQNWMVYHNTMVNNNHDFSGPNSTWTVKANDYFTAIRGDSTAGLFVKNNIMAQHNHREISFASVGGQYEISNNLYWHTGTPQFSTNYQEPNRRIARPLFINIPTSFRPTGNHTQYDFHLVENNNNPAINSGVPLTTTRSAGSGATVPVNNARYFFGGNGTINADTIEIGSNTAADSLYINVDAPPQDPEMTWDIIPLTQGFQERTVSWRGSRAFDNNEFNPKYFQISSGSHTLFIVGREAEVKIDKIHLEKTDAATFDFRLILSHWFTNTNDRNQDNIFNILDWLNIFKVELFAFTHLHRVNL